MTTKMASITKLTVSFLAAASVGFSAAHAQEEIQSSPYGPDDTLGAINALSAKGVIKAAKLVKTGKTYSLGVTTGPETPAWGERSYAMEIVKLGPFGANKLTAHDDRLISHLGIGSQIDGLGHIGVDGVHYNGHKADDFAAPDGVNAFGMEALPPIVTRGVLIDMARHFGVDQLAPGAAFNSDDVKAALNAQKIEVRRGDVVIFHTGWLSMADEDPDAFIGAAPGLDVDGARYLADLGVVAIGADTVGLEPNSTEDSDIAFPVHEFLLARRGVYILENMNTNVLAADKAYEFLFVLGQPKFEGAVQAVINPVAIR